MPNDSNYILFVDLTGVPVLGHMTHYDAYSRIWLSQSLLLSMLPIKLLYCTLKDHLFTGEIMSASPPVRRNGRCSVVPGLF